MKKPRPVRRRKAANPELAELRARLEEAEETIEAIRSGAVDAFVVNRDGGDQIYTVYGADRPYRILVESMQQGALVLGDDATILFANGRVAELLDVPADHVAGTAFTRFVPAAQRARFDELITRGLQEDVSLELELIRGGGPPLPVYVTASPMPLDGTSALTMILTDLTREHQMRDADRRKDEFLAMVAHELRNPLGPVRNLLEVLRLKGAPTPDVEWARNVIDRQVRRMSRLVDELLDLSAIAHDRIVLQRGTVVLQEVIQAAVDECAPLLDQWGHELVLSLPGEPLHLHADAARLTQVFANLLANAANYTTRFGRIEIAATVTGATVAIAVRDNGSGIPTDQLPRIWEMFARVDRTVRGEQTSLGIGLAMVHKLITLHGGAVEARSAGPGQGSEFIVRLPVDARAPRATLPVPRGDDEVPPLRILVVDDGVDSADSLAAMLRLSGHEVRATYDGMTALDVGHDFEPQLVLLDLAMPGLDGHETCREMRTADWGRHARIVAITGRGQPEDRDLARVAGFDQFLEKPVGPEQLKEIVNRVARRQTPAAGKAR